MKRKAKPTEDDINSFMVRLDFLETMWGCKAEYEVDESSGRGWVKIRMPGTKTVLSILDLDVRDILVPGDDTET